MICSVSNTLNEAEVEEKYFLNITSIVTRALARSGITVVKLHVEAALKYFYVLTTNVRCRTKTLVPELLLISYPPRSTIVAVPTTRLVWERI